MMLMSVFSCCNRQCGVSVLMKSLCLLLLASVFYVLAMLTNYWFTRPPHSYHGLWSVTFCDFLRCQIISALDDEAPRWYQTLQILSIIGFIFLSCSILLVVSTSLSKFLPASLVCKHPAGITALCIMSVLALSSTLVVFYVNLLMESSPHYHPYFSWSSLAACLACILESCAACLLIQEP